MLEAEIAGFGASGRNGGWCSALLPMGLDAIARRARRDGARVALQQAMLDTVDEVGEAPPSEGIDCRLRQGRRTSTWRRNPAQLTRAAGRARRERAVGLRRRAPPLLDAAAAVGARSPSTGALGALFTPHCAALHPARLARGLAAAVERRGRHDLRAHAGVGDRARPGRAPTAARCGPTSSCARPRGTRRLAGQRRTLAPLYSLMIATEPLPATFWDAVGLRERETFNDGRHLIIYGQRTAGRPARLRRPRRAVPLRLARSGPASTATTACTPTCAGAARAVPGPRRGAAITHRWGGRSACRATGSARSASTARTGLAWAGGYVGDGVGDDATSPGARSPT